MKVNFSVFVNEKALFIKGCPKATQFIILLLQKLQKIKKGEYVVMNVESRIVKELSEKYKIKEKIILKMFQIGISYGYCINEIRTMIIEFEGNNNCY